MESLDNNLQKIVIFDGHICDKNQDQNVKCFSKKDVRIITSFIWVNQLENEWNLWLNCYSFILYKNEFCKRKNMISTETIVQINVRKQRIACMTFGKEINRVNFQRNSMII